MTANQTSRRNFIKTLTASSLTTLIIPDSFTSFENDINSQTAGGKNGMVFLFQGDSITDGNRGRRYTDLNHIMGHGFAFSIASRLGCDFPEKNLKFINRGVSGNKVTDLADRWKEDALDLNPDVLTILVGINDTNSVIDNKPNVTPVTLQKFDEVYRSILDQAIKQNPEITFVLCQPFIFKYASTLNNWELRYNDMIQRQKVVEKISSDYKAIYLKLQDVFDEAAKKAPAGYWIWDGVHPTVAGHELITREWIRQVRKKIKFIKSVC